MSNNELEKKMDFIVEHLAALTAKQEKTEDLLGRLATASLNRITDPDNKVSALADAQIKPRETCLLWPRRRYVLMRD
jgi:hypothetical protein